MTKPVTCKRCGEANLKWAQTKAGKWYLTPMDPTYIRGEHGRAIKTLNLAHQCAKPEKARNDQRDERYIALRQTKEFKEGWDAHDRTMARVREELGDWE